MNLLLYPTTHINFFPNYVSIYKYLQYIIRVIGLLGSKPEAQLYRIY